MDIELVKDLVSALALFSIPISITAYLRTRHSQSLDRIHTLTDRLYEIDKLVMQYPRNQELLHQTLNATSPYFVASTPHNEEYFRLKSFIYFHLNFISEMFAITEDDPQLSKRFEVESWKAYFIAKLRHPLFREIALNEGDAFGDQFKRFISDHAAEIRQPPHPEIY
jgi:hypothetical protein